MVTEAKVWEALGTVMDPEVPFSVVDLGLVYGVEVPPSGAVRVQLTLTTRGCPLVRRITEDAGGRDPQGHGRDRRAGRDRLGSAVEPGDGPRRPRCSRHCAAGA